MRSSLLRKTGLAGAAAAASALVAIGVPLAIAAPDNAPVAAPPSDSRGYVDSTARCASPDTAVIFGTTDSSRVAICETAAGGYEYRGVRVRDGARLITTASRTTGGTFVADNDGVKYTVTDTALSVTANGDTFRTETWIDFHTEQGTSTSTSGTSTSTPSTSAPKTSASPTTSAPKTSTAPSSSAVPLPPPMPAEVGGDSDE